jgi:hypothetical protein
VKEEGLGLAIDQKIGTWVVKTLKHRRTKRIWFHYNSPKKIAKLGLIEEDKGPKNPCHLGI